MPDDAITFDFPIDLKRTFRALDSSDDIGMILRMHYEIERTLDHVITKFMPFPDKLGLKYPGQKLKLLAAFGVPDIRLAPAKKVNQIRNRFAHKGSEVLQESDIVELYGSIMLVSDGKFNDEFEIVIHRSGVANSRKFRDLNVREKFWALASVTITVTAAFPHELERVLASQRDSG